jgi:tRNA(Ile)-lysidine synthase
MRGVDHPVVLALSGGGDSMAMLEIAAGWTRASGRRLLALTVDHGLNPASPDWSRLCAGACADLKVDWIETRWQGDKPVTGLTAAARRARHRLIAEAARAAGARIVLLAHTANDIAESDWMRSRGSTLGRLRDWSPSPVWPEGRGLMLFRPLLQERRESLRDFLREKGRGWVEDPANTDLRFGRSRAREALRAEAGRSGTAARRPPDVSGDGPLPLPLGEGFALGRDVREEMLAATLICASGDAAPPRHDRLSRLCDRLRAGEDFSATLTGARVQAAGARVLIGREPGEFRRRPPGDLLLTRGEAAVWDGRYEIVITEPGWTVCAAAGRLNRLSDADRAIVATVPAWARGALPVLVRSVPIRDGADGPVLAWRKAEVRALGPRRLALFCGALSGETTQEADLFRTIHGETPPADLFSHKDHHCGPG